MSITVITFYEAQEREDQARRAFDRARHVFPHAYDEYNSYYGRDDTRDMYELVILPNEHMKMYEVNGVEYTQVT